MIPARSGAARDDDAFGVAVADPAVAQRGPRITVDSDRCGAGPGDRAILEDSAGRVRHPQAVFRRPGYRDPPQGGGSALAHRDAVAFNIVDLRVLKDRGAVTAEVDARRSG